MDFNSLNLGKIFLAGVFAIVSGYLFFMETSFAAKYVGGGILALLAIITLLGAFQEKKK